MQKKNPNLELRGKTHTFFQIGLIIALLSAIGFLNMSFDLHPTDDYQPKPYKEPHWIDITYEAPRPPQLPKKTPQIKQPFQPEAKLKLTLEDLTESMIPPDTTPPPILKQAPVSFIKRPPAPPSTGNEIPTYASDMPEFPGGELAFRKFLAKKVNFPEAALQMDWEGKVMLSFVVSENGTLTDIKVEDSNAHPDCEKEAIRALNASPVWKPGRQNDEPVKVRMYVPIEFKTFD